MCRGRPSMVSIFRPTYDSSWLRNLTLVLKDLTPSWQCVWGQRGRCQQQQRRQVCQQHQQQPAEREDQLQFQRSRCAVRVTSIQALNSFPQHLPSPFLAARQPHLPYMSTAPSSAMASWGVMSLPLPAAAAFLAMIMLICSHAGRCRRVVGKALQPLRLYNSGCACNTPNVHIWPCPDASLSPQHPHPDRPCPSTPLPYLPQPSLPLNVPRMARCQNCDMDKPLPWTCTPPGCSR